MSSMMSCCDFEYFKISAQNTVGIGVDDIIISSLIPVRKVPNPNFYLK